MSQRYTEPNTDVRTIPPEEIWIGIIDAPRPYIALVTKLDNDEDDAVVVCRFGSPEARAMAAQLGQYAASLEAPNN